MEVVKLSQTVSINFDNGFVYWNEAPSDNIKLTPNEIKIMTFLFNQYNNGRKGKVSNMEIFEFLHNRPYNPDKDDIQTVTRAVSKLRVKTAERFRMYDIIGSDERGNFWLIEFPFESSANLSEYANHINSMPFPAEITKNIFNFCNKKIEFRGRETELNQLKTWLNDEYAIVWAVTGQGGSGKSRLALHFADETETQQKAKVVWLEKKAQLEELLACDDYSYPQPVLFICDYASHYEDQLKTLIEDISRAHANAKFLLLERSAAWYISFFKSSDTVHDCVFSEEPVNLDNSPLSPEDYKLIMQDISAARHGGKQIPDAVKEQIIDKAQELSVEGKAGRCLFLMLLTDEYLRNEDAGILNMNATDLLHNYFKHSYDILKKNYNADILDAGRRVLAYATACDGIQFSEMQDHPAVQEEWRTINQAFRRRSEIIQFLQQLSETDKRDTVPAMKPDLLGEFMFLREWGDLMDEPRGAWLTSLLKQEYSRFFFAMCLTDWPGESKSLNDWLSDLSADCDQRTYSALVLFNTILLSESDTEQVNLIRKIKSLDHDYSAKILSSFTSAIRFVYETTAKEIKEQCNSIIYSIEWNRYICETETEYYPLLLSYNNVATIKSRSCDYTSALNYYNKALDIGRKFLGTENDDIPALYCNIGHVLKDIGQSADALKHYKIALEMRKKILGTTHPSIALIYSSIALTYYNMGKYKEARKYCSTALNIQKCNQDLDTAATYNCMGLIEEALGNYNEALINFRLALEIREKLYWYEDSEIAESYTNIGLSYRGLHNYNEALNWFTKARLIYEKIYDADHVATASCYNNIGLVLLEDSNTRNYDDALVYFNKALKIRNKLLGPEHPETVMSKNNIATVLIYLEDYKSALKSLKEVLDVRIKTQGAEHPETAQAYHNIASAYAGLEDYQEAIKNYKASLSIKLKVIGTKHPDTAITYNNMAFAYIRIGDVVNAIKCFNNALAVFDELYGKDNDYSNNIVAHISELITSAECYFKIAMEYIDKQNYMVALNYLGIPLAVFQSYLGSEHPNTAITYKSIAIAYYALSDYKNSIQFLRRAFNSYKKIYGINHEETLKIQKMIDEIKPHI